MKTVSMLLLLAWCLDAPAVARARDRDTTTICALTPPPASYSVLANKAPTPRAARELKRLVTLMCPERCGRVTLFQNPTLESLLVVNAGMGSTRIEYNPAFLDKVREVFGDAAGIGTLAHAFGHHVDLNAAPAAWMNAAWADPELRADAWAACALAKAGLKTEPLREELRAISGQEPTNGSTSGQREAAMKQGYLVCGPMGRTNVAAFVAGCSSNADCRLGRQCVDGRCEKQFLTMQGGCSRDIDCPENQICTPLGRCTPLSASGQFMSAADTASTAKVSPPAMDEAQTHSCNLECRQERRQCRVSAVASLNACLRGVTSKSTFKDCHCPAWPNDRPECRRVCEEAFDSTDECESAYGPEKQTCFSEAVACRNCQPTQ